MAFTEPEYLAVKTEVEKFLLILRPSKDNLHRVNFTFTIREQSVELSQLRKKSRRECRFEPTLPFAKINYLRSIDMWRLYFKENGDWQAYSTFDFVMLEDALAEIWADPNNFFTMNCNS